MHSEFSVLSCSQITSPFCKQTLRWSVGFELCEMGFCVGGSSGARVMRMGGRRAVNHPDPSAIGVDIWELAEEMAQEVVNYIHPTMDSEEKRKDVTEFMQRLLKCYTPCEVFPYGSVPLKTYLPDGDIDLTALSIADNEESLAYDVLAILQAEEWNENAEYIVRDTRFIDAEVKLVKCVVQDIVIDISFNQLGGLCTLCFLEQVDRLVGKNHLFKRTIILIKCWCYYESRILGAHHGLISTYALEVLVLYIFQVFHASLNTPVAVLYRFLDYYSRFDWENFCISLIGPVRKSSLPEIVVDMPDNGRNNLLLSEEFLRNCMEMFSVPSRVPEINKRPFQQKHLNILDPLKENNNLGRSVHRGNYYRICSAFKYGVRKLGQILLLPQDKIGDGIKKFFSNTIKRHGSNRLTNLNSTLSIDADSSVISSSPSLVEFFSEEELLLRSSVGDLDEMEDNNLTKAVSSEISCFADLSSVLEKCLSGDANDHAAPAHFNPNDPSDCSSGGIYGDDHFAQNLPCTKLSQNERSESVDEKLGCVEDVSVDFREKDVASIAGDLDWNPFTDLTGDYDGHIRNLLYGKCCHGYALTAAPVPFPFWFQNDLMLADQQTMPPPGYAGPMLYPAGNALPPPAPFNFEEKQRARGTGTFIPTMANSYRERSPFKGKGKNRFSGGLQRSTSSHGFEPALPPKGSAEYSSGREDSYARPPAQERGKFSPYRQYHHAAGDSRGSSYPSSQFAGEFGSPRQYPPEPSLSGSSHAWAAPRFPQKVPCAKPMWGRKDRFADQPLGPEE